MDQWKPVDVFGFFIILAIVGIWISSSWIKYDGAIIPVTTAGFGFVIKHYFDTGAVTLNTINRLLKKQQNGEIKEKEVK